MAKFRTVNTRATVIENRAGGEAYEQTPKLALISLKASSILAEQGNL